MAIAFPVLNIMPSFASPNAHSAHGYVPSMAANDVTINAGFFNCNAILASIVTDNFAVAVLAMTGMALIAAPGAPVNSNIGAPPIFAALAAVLKPCAAPPKLTLPATPVPVSAKAAAYGLLAIYSSTVLNTLLSVVAIISVWSNGLTADNITSLTLPQPFGFAAACCTVWVIGDGAAVVVLDVLSLLDLSLFSSNSLNPFAASSLAVGHTGSLIALSANDVTLALF